MSCLRCGIGQTNLAQKGIIVHLNGDGYAEKENSELIWCREPSRNYFPVSFSRNVNHSSLQEVVIVHSICWPPMFSGQTFHWTSAV